MKKAGVKNSGVKNSGVKRAGVKKARVKEKKAASDKNRFSIKMQKKLVVLYTFVLLAFAGLSVRIIWIIKEDGTKYQKQVLAQQRYDSTTLPYRRGDIVDAKGTRLAASEKVYNLVIDSKVMTSTLGGKTVYLDPTIQALAQYFGLEASATREYVTTHQNSSYYVPLKQLTYEQIKDFQAAAMENDKIKGVWFEEEYKRVYPYNSLAADVIGFTNKDNVGSYGLEEYYNDILNGINGREYGYLNDDSTLERTVKAAVDGYTIHSTIDATVQMMVEKHLKKYNEEMKDSFRAGNGAENIACIMMWVDTAEILAMASYPTYDLNDVRNPQSLLGSRMVEEITNAAGYQEIKKTDTIITAETLAAMDDDQMYVNLNYLWKNFCVSDTYEPGSTAKPFTVAAALEAGAVSTDTTVECTGYLEIGGHKISCHGGSDGWLTLEEAVAKSCNVAMMKIANMLGAEDFCKFQQTFNFGLRTNIDLAGEARTASLIYKAEDMGPTDLATNSFGQNFNVTMIEMITGFCSLINGGYYYEPHVVNKITNSSGATVQNIEPRVLKQTVSESTSELIRQYCNAVVTYGTGKTARPAGYAIGGKTGTAETIDPNTHIRSEDEYVLSFIGYAPADNPQVAIYVVVDRPNTKDQTNTRIATGLVRNILTEVLPYLNIFMTEELSEAERKELEELQIQITNQYTQTPEGDALDNLEGGGENGDNTAPQQPWMNYPIDPESGYRVDPDTGKKYDPDTGVAVEGAESVPNPSIPVNPNIR